MSFPHSTIIRHGDREGRLKQRAVTFINNLKPDKDQEYEVKVSIYKSRRSLEQNSYFHAVIVKYASEEFGMTTKEAKEALKEELLPMVPIKKFNGSVVERPTNTSDLNTKQMSDFIDQCIILLASYGVIVPNPQYRHL